MAGQLGVSLPPAEGLDWLGFELLRRKTPSPLKRPATFEQRARADEARALFSPGSVLSHALLRPRRFSSRGVPGMLLNGWLRRKSFGFSLRPSRFSRQPMQRHPPYGSMPASFQTLSRTQ
jgi:hypothetical protein